MKEQYLPKKVLWGTITVILLVVLDQFTKALAVKHLKNQASIVLWKGVFELHYLENRGAAFGLLQNRQILFIVGTSILLAAIIWFYLKRIPNEKRFVWLNYIAVLFAAGAIGNFIDRVIQNYVVDFFYFSLIDFPIFNVADIYVVVAMFLLIALILFYYKDDELERLLPSTRKKPHNGTSQ